jgi:hypothetical protein
MSASHEDDASSGRSAAEVDPLLRGYRIWLATAIPIVGLVVGIVAIPENTIKWLFAGVCLLSFAMIVAAVGAQGAANEVRRTRISVEAASAGPQLAIEQSNAAIRALAEDVSTAAERIGALSSSIDQVRDSTSEVAEQTRNIAEIAVYHAKWSLGARALYLDRMSRPVRLVHSHRPELAPHVGMVQEQKPVYTVPPYPIDEADVIPMVSQWILSSRTWISAAEAVSTRFTNVSCDCVVEHELQGDAEVAGSVLRRDLVLIGSTVYNKTTERCKPRPCPKAG